MCWLMKFEILQMKASGGILYIPVGMQQRSFFLSSSKSTLLSLRQLLLCSSIASVVVYDLSYASGCVVRWSTFTFTV